MDGYTWRTSIDRAYVIDGVAQRPAHDAGYNQRCDPAIRGRVGTSWYKTARGDRPSVCSCICCCFGGFCGNEFITSYIFDSHHVIGPSDSA